MYNTNSQIEFKTSMLRLSLCNHSDAYILVSGTITITGEETDYATKQANEGDQEVIIENYTPFTKCINKITKTHVDYAQEIDVVRPIYKLIKYTDNSLKTSGSLWQYYRDEANATGKFRIIQI